MNDTSFPLGGVSGPLTLEEHYLLLMAPMDRRLRAIIEERVLPEPRQRVTLETLSRRFGLTRERLRPLEAKARARLTELPAFHSAAFLGRAAGLTAELGPLAPADGPRTRLAFMHALYDVSPAHQKTLRRLLLRIADYQTVDGWLIAPGAELPSSDTAIEQAGGEGSTWVRLRAALEELGVPAVDHDAWLARHPDLVILRGRVARATQDAAKRAG